MVESACTSTQVLRGVDADAKVPLGSVNSIAYFVTVPVDRDSDCLQTVAVRLTGGGSFLPGTLKSTLALQNVGSIVAYTAHLSETYDAIN